MTIRFAEEETVGLLTSDGDGHLRDARVRFATDALRSYAFDRFDPTVYDAMVVAAAVEFGDRTIARTSRWTRDLRLRVPVHEPSRWRSEPVASALREALSYLTGDDWAFDFVDRHPRRPVERQGRLALDPRTRSVMLYSDGMDSRAVAGLLDLDRPGSVACVRVGRKSAPAPLDGSIVPFARIPFAVASPLRRREASARSRGFKFALVGGVAARLAGADEVVLPESGQGVVGPALVRVGSAPPDVRNHPLFTRRMERLVEALLGGTVRYAFPRIWNTKGETLREFSRIDPAGTWASTRSCWQDARAASLLYRRVQCGCCAACMLRRLSVHAAGLHEPEAAYLCDLDAAEFGSSLDPALAGRRARLSRHAIAGILHMDHLADMALPQARPAVSRHAALLARTMESDARIVEERLRNVLAAHASEWAAFLRQRSPSSFVRRIARAVP